MLGRGRGLGAEPREPRMSGRRYGSGIDNIQIPPTTNRVDNRGHVD